MSDTRVNGNWLARGVFRVGSLSDGHPIVIGAHPPRDIFNFFLREEAKLGGQIYEAICQAVSW